MTSKSQQWPALLCAAVLQSLFIASAQADDALIAAGAELYAENCARCHGDEAEGLQQYDGDLAALTARLDGLTEGMPDFAGYFDEAEVAALQAFLEARTGK